MQHIDEFVPFKLKKFEVGEEVYLIGYEIKNDKKRRLVKPLSTRGTVTYIQGPNIRVKWNNGVEKPAGYQDIISTRYRD